MLTLFRTQVERALTFWRDGHITLGSVSQGGKMYIQKPIDLKTGKEMKTTEFNQAKWGVATNGYLESIKTNIKFDWARFIKAASKFKKPSRHASGSTIASSSRTSTGHVDARALIVDDSDGSESDVPDGHGSSDCNASASE